MSELDQGNVAEVITGSMFLYEQPELLTLEDHGKLGLTPPEQPYGFAKTARAIPLLQTEFSSAMKHYPIVFSAIENPRPLAITGVLDENNLFVDKDGHWDPLSYVPSYLRRYPFALATAEGSRMAAVIDRKASSVMENAKFPFFENEELAGNTRQMMEFCAQYEAGREQTRIFCEKLVQYDLLTTQRATHKADENSEPVLLANYVTIDTEKLTGLPDDAIVELHRSGMLSSMYLQIYSVQNWRSLVSRRTIG